MTDKLPERQGKNKEIRQSKNVLWTVAIGAVIAMVAVQAKKILDSVEKSSQEPVAEAVEKASEESKKEEKPKIKNGIPQNEQTFGALMENSPPAVFKEPKTPEEACDALKYSDPAYYPVYPALKLVADSFVTFYDLGKIGAECDLNSDEIMEILKGGVEQGDADTGRIVKNMMHDKCESEFRSSLDSEIMRGQKERAYKEKCQNFPDSPYEQCMEKSRVSEEAEKCKEVYDKGKEKCNGDRDSNLACHIAMIDALMECRDKLSRKCDDLSMDSPRIECEIGVDEEYYPKQDEWIGTCENRSMLESGFDPNEVKTLTEQGGDIPDEGVDMEERWIYKVIF